MHLSYNNVKVIADLDLNCPPEYSTLVSAKNAELALSYGYTAARSAGSVWAQVNPVGAGNVVLFADDPAHRKYWLGTERLLINALFLSNHLAPGGRR